MKIQVAYTSTNSQIIHESIEVSRPTESSIMKAAGSVVPKMTFPGTLQIDTKYGRVHLEYLKRGTYIDKDGTVLPSPHIDITQCYSTLSLPYSTDYPHVMLECINTTKATSGYWQANNYKFYELLPEGSHLRAFYGRIGAEDGTRYGRREVKKPYDSYLFWPLYFEKIAKRYEDVSANFFSKTATVSMPKEEEQKALFPDSSLIKDGPVVQELYNYLLNCSRQIVNKTFVTTEFTSGQIATASKLLQKLEDSCDSLDHFNDTLKELLLFIPRRTRNIASEFAKNENDFSSIIDREESYLRSMEAVYWNQSHSKNQSGKPGFHGKVREATAAEAEEVYKNLSDSLKPHVKHIYHVVWPEKEKAYQDFLKAYPAKSKRAWHGSGNANWLSILNTGLKVDPPTNAHITGKMLGYGIYCALGKEGSEKANGYNSHYGSRWAHGASSKSFMALLTIAYAPIHAQDNTEIHSYSLTELKQANATCVHAHAKDTFLARDEVCCYYEEGIMVTDLVEFE